MIKLGQEIPKSEATYIAHSGKDRIVVSSQPFTYKGKEAVKEGDVWLVRLD